MRILFAGDEQTYSAYTLSKASSLAMNTWADVTLLAVAGGSAGGVDPESSGSVSATLSRYREKFLTDLNGHESPYTSELWCYRWMPLRNEVWEEVRVCSNNKKELKVRMRKGQVANEILAESQEAGSDLIVIGCSKGRQCSWSQNAGVPQKVVSNANCSVLLVKEDLPIKKIIACVDQTPASQDSLEMINQMVTIHNAELELVGLTKGGGVESKAYQKLMQVADYYNDRGVKAKMQLLEVTDFEEFITTKATGDLLALWMGKKSLLDRFFPRDWVGKFVASSPSSVLVLR